MVKVQNYANRQEQRKEKSLRQTPFPQSILPMLPTRFANTVVFHASLFSSEIYVYDFALLPFKVLHIVKWELFIIILLTC